MASFQLSNGRSFKKKLAAWFHYRGLCSKDLFSMAKASENKPSLNNTVLLWKYVTRW